MIIRTSIAVVVLLGSSVLAGAAHACACCGTYKVVDVQPGDVLNMRAGPGASYRMLGAIPSGSGCVIKSRQCRRSWCKVSYAGQSGWVHSRYLAYVK